MPLTIAEVEVIPVYPKLAQRYAHRHADYYTIDHRDFFKVTGSDGTVGWGETRARPATHLDPETYKDLAGRNPFEVVHSPSINSGLCTALYDLIGKHVGLPVHALLGGDKVRDWVPCAAWTRPASPADFQADVQRAADEGYMVFKMHTASHFDPIQQVKAAEACDLPPGFRLHLDFNHNRTLASLLPLLRELEEEHPIVGFIEDPVVSNDLEAWCAIRAQCSIPIIFQSPPIKAVQMLARGPADICEYHSL
jgi:galactonate dehydratase